jgi:hypothetical protein
VAEQRIDPLPIAASLWERTHVILSADAEIAEDVAKPTKLNGKSFASGVGDPDGHQNNETKPIRRPEAG